jgi:signal transduction histidine kinase
MTDDQGKLTDFLVLPMLEPEHTGDQIGRNRLNVVGLISQAIDNAVIQVWLVEHRKDGIDEMRLAYFYPAPADDKALSGLTGVFVKAFRREGRSPSSVPPPELMNVVEAKYSELAPGVRKPDFFAIQPPVPIDTGRGPETRQAGEPIAWLFAAPISEVSEDKKEKARLLAYRLATLFDYGRAHRVVEATKASGESVLKNSSLAKILEECSRILIRACAAERGGYVTLINGTVRSITFTQDLKCDAKTQASIEKFARTEIKDVNEIKSYGIDVVDGLEMPDPASSGAFLYVPIISPGFSLHNSKFVPVNETNGIGKLGEFPSYAFFLSGKKSLNYLGTSFSGTDSTLCQAVAKRLSGAAFAKFFEEENQNQGGYFAGMSFEETDVTSAALARIKSVIPSAISLELITAQHNTEGKLELKSASRTGEPAPSVICELLLEYSNEIRGEVFGGHVTGAIEGMRYACRVDKSGSATIIFLMTTRYMPLRYYVLRLESNLLEGFRLQLLKQLMHELFLVHRAQDNADERTSLLAQIRHAVIDPLAAANSAITNYQWKVKVFSKTEDRWRMLRTDPEVQDIIPQAISLTTQALLIIDSGRFLVTSQSFDEIKFEQVNPLKLINSVRNAYNYLLRERGQCWSLKVTGNSNRMAVGDKILLWMAVANLVANAVKYGHRNTEVGIILDCQHELWTFAVENSGGYLAPELADKIFQLFERAPSGDPSVTRRHGTGLGLPITQTILYAHNKGSKLTYTSQKLDEQSKAVTRFTFSLPYRIAGGGNSEGKGGAVD